MGYLKPTRLDLQVLARKLLPFATIVRLAIFYLIKMLLDLGILGFTSKRISEIMPVCRSV